MTIVEALAGATGSEPAVASVYAALDRLERRGFVASEMGPSTPERGGRAKRYFSLLPAGVTALQRSRDVLNALWDGLDLDAPA